MLFLLNQIKKIFQIEQMLNYQLNQIFMYKVDKFFETNEWLAYKNKVNISLLLHIIEIIADVKNILAVFDLMFRYSGQYLYSKNLYINCKLFVFLSKSDIINT